MADFGVGNNTLAPTIGQPQTVVDSGAIITLTNAGAGTTNSADQENNGGRGLAVVLDITANSGTIDVTLNIQVKDKASGKYITLLSSVSKTATGTYRYVVYPTITASANLIAQDVLPEIWRLQVVCGAGSSPQVTLTAGACVIP
jgi:hypothetical protein